MNPLHLPSVTTLLEKMFPFNPEFFKKSLGKDNMLKKRDKGLLVPGGIADINEELYYDSLMEMLCIFGSSIHSYANHRGLGFPPHRNCPDFLVPYHETIDMFFDENEVKLVKSESVVIVPGEYQGTFDMLAIVNGDLTLIDWKTWGIYKEFYGIVEEKQNFRDKEKKVSIQLSMYQRGLALQNLYPVHRMCVWVGPRRFQKIYMPYNIQPYFDFFQIHEDTIQPKE